MTLLARLQNEVSGRTRNLQEMESHLRDLREQGTLLDLSSEQKKALETLLHRRPVASEIFLSLDFWLGRFLLNAAFFLAGVVFTVWRSRKASAELRRLERIEKSINQLIAEKRLTPEDAERIGVRATAAMSSHPAYMAGIVDLIILPAPNVQSAQRDRKE
jgi:hypothetical protein